jgi:hypothetical protein
VDRLYRELSSLALVSRDCHSFSCFFTHGHSYGWSRLGSLSHYYHASVSFSTPWSIFLNLGRTVIHGHAWSFFERLSRQFKFICTWWLFLTVSHDSHAWSPIVTLVAIGRSAHHYRARLISFNIVTCSHNWTRLIRLGHASLSFFKLGHLWTHSVMRGQTWSSSYFFTYFDLCPFVPLGT